MLIKEKIKPLQPFRVDNGNIHGHVCIDLHNTKSGFTERIQGDNLVTNAAQDILNLAALGYVTPPYNLLPLATNLLGGLLIFDGTLQENVDNVEFPGSQAKFVGCAGNAVDTSLNYLGIRNNEESGVIQGGYKTVWDFSTNCCNKTIRSLARTSSNNGNKLIDGTALWSWGRVNDSSYKIIKDFKLYDIKNKTIYKIPINGIDVYNDNSIINTSEILSNSNYLSLLSGYNTDNIRFQRNTDHSNKFSSYNLLTDQITEYTCSKSFKYFTKMGNYIYAVNNNEGIYKIQINNTSNYSLINNHNNVFYPLGKTLFNTYSQIFYDDDTVIYLDSSVNRSRYDSYWWFYGFTSFHDKPFFYTINGYYGDLCIRIADGFLGTIFNLPEAITKTANQTMKITYTLTNV